MENSKFPAAYKAANIYFQENGLIDSEPIVFNMRGICAYKIGEFNDAVSDFSKFLSSKQEKDFDSRNAHLYRGLSYLKLGHIEDADIDSNECDNPELKENIKTAKYLLSAAGNSLKEGQKKISFEQHIKLLNYMPASVNIILQTSELALELGNYSAYQHFISKASNMDPKNPRLYTLYSREYFSKGEIAEATKKLKNCINTASESSICTKMLKTINQYTSYFNNATASLSRKEFSSAKINIDSCQKIIENFSLPKSNISMIINNLYVKLLIGKGEKKEALKYLDSLIDSGDKSITLLLDRADINLELGDHDSAAKDYNEVIKKQKNNKRASEGLKKVSQLKEKEKNFNYYEVLGLKKGAPIKDVNEAFKKLVVKWHPDRFRDPIKKKEAEKKMKQINTAMDVLGDPEKKKMYDMGYDPDGQPGPQQQDGNGEQHINFGDFGGGFTGFNGFGGPDFAEFIQKMMGGGGGQGNFRFRAGNNAFRFH